MNKNEEKNPKVICEKCEGTGLVSPAELCEVCEGSGSVAK